MTLQESNEQLDLVNFKRNLLDFWSEEISQLKKFLKILNLSAWRKERDIKRYPWEKCYPKSYSPWIFKCKMFVLDGICHFMDLRRSIVLNMLILTSLTICACRKTFKYENFRSLCRSKIHTFHCWRKSIYWNSTKEHVPVHKIVKAFQTL